MSCRDTAIIASPQTTEGFDAKDSVGAGDVRRDWGGLLVRLCRIGDHSGAGAIFPRLRRPPAADRARVAHGERRGSAAQVVAGALLAAAAIGGVPGVTSRLFSSLVSRCRAEGLLVATASASAGAHFRLGRLGKEDEDEAGSGDW